MKRWISLLVLSLVIGIGLAWIARPLEVQFRWGDRPDQSATLAVRESTAQAEWSPEERNAIAGAETMSKAFAAIAREVSPSVVTIHSERVVTANRPGGNNPFGGMFPDDFFGRFFQMPDRIPQRGMGSGVIVSSNGRVLTNNHVVANADRVRVTLSDGRTFDAKVLGRDEKSDLAVVQIDADNLPAAHLGDSDRLEVGEWVLAIGNPFELTQTVTAGIVSAKGRSSVGLADYEDFIQTDAAINPGNSGGALVNLDGDVVGINTAIATRTGGYQGVGFAIPMNMASKIMDSLVRTGKVVRGYIGVTIQDVDAAIADNYGLDHPYGALVNSVSNGGPAAEAGLKAGDLITELNGQQLKNRDDLRLKIGEMEPGTRVEMKAIRDGSTKTFQLRLAEFQDTNEMSENSDDSSGDNQGSALDKFGFGVQPLDRATRQRFEIGGDVGGVLVTEVEPGSAAFDAGLR
ncbi:MAG: DegQ family serine endoprotease, partial [Candidatus Eisenbacteria bacterium]|nr:DegQ family serine endoprotease [Candidatus Eisenbacteria bacterium]